MEHSFRTKAGISLITGLLILCLVITAYSKTHPRLVRFGNQLILEVASPFSFAIDNIQRFWGSVFQDYFALVEVKKEQGALRQQLHSLEMENFRLQELGYENQRLKKLLTYVETQQIQGVLADVIYYSNVPANKTITINLGSKAGVAIEDAVINQDAVVGKVISVASNSSTVLLLNDFLSSIDGRLLESRVRGIINGSGSDELFWEFVREHAQVKIGDYVVTSGLDGVFPKGLKIGVVKEIQHSISKSLFKTIKIKPEIDFDLLESVYVIRRNNA